jgi:AcrR family transcriptional regulator
MTSKVTTKQKSARPRGRPQSFDSAAIRTCFARKGFSGTSIEDLSETTVLGTPSLYNAFGDKRHMFLRSLDLECEDVVSKATTVGYHGYDPIPGIAFGAALVDASDDPEVARCLRDFSTELDLVADVLGPKAPPRR